MRPVDFSLSAPDGARLTEVCVLPRLYIGDSLSVSAGLVLNLPEGAARHVQVLRMQPGDLVQVFAGDGLDWQARITEMGRKTVQVEVEQVAPNDRELPIAVTLAMGMPANDRMDALVEKATELGVAAIQPLVCARSVLRLDGERAAKKVAHWQAVVVSACEQSGRSVVPRVLPVQTLAAFLQSQPSDKTVTRGVLSLRDAISMRQWLDQADAASDPGVDTRAEKPQWLFLSGPEGGLAPEEESLALSLGWTAISLGARVLRADTAPLAALSVMGARYEG
jgi:16S rRNA (uracil1498-N3)-methyltransferase